MKEPHGRQDFFVLPFVANLTIICGLQVFRGRSLTPSLHVFSDVATNRKMPQHLCGSAQEQGTNFRGRWECRTRKMANYPLAAIGNRCTELSPHCRGQCLQSNIPASTRPRLKTHMHPFRHKVLSFPRAFVSSAGKCVTCGSGSVISRN